METIFALASGPGKSGIAVIRISGMRAFPAAEMLGAKPSSNRQHRLCILHNQDGEVLDQALVLGFPAPGSFTGEDVVELQLHGSPAIVHSVMAELSQLYGLRQAEPGEFTRRALENSKMNLAQVEGLADLIDAETEGQRIQAQRVFAGQLGDKVDRWRDRLLRSSALIEAMIDFADEDIPFSVSREVENLLIDVRTELQQETDGVNIAERIRDGFEVAIVGKPNVGKSTLLNALTGRQAALTSDMVGTTRDVIEVRMDLAGLPVTLLDTAGIRETSDMVEELGISATRKRAATADLRVFLVDQDGPPMDVEPKDDDIIVRGKADIETDEKDNVSGVTGQGIDRLIAQIGDVLSQRAAGAGTAIRRRHADAMRCAITSLDNALAILSTSPDQYDITAEEIRAAIRALETIVGRIEVEDIFDEIFSRFCIGK
ncbi:MAG: tRNA uridine-5-carboxymethylaminomethyl(34) synthesis GTPase MnmE [Rhodobacteraceae bacterium]|nr:tRNA uridine-5-carboxymethylaminomethyl(34) synthesis GTPase MnmE [Paracoccaceae bacterium]